MKRIIEVKHVAPRAHVQALLEELSDRVAEKLRHFPEDAVSLHVFFEENGQHALYRLALTCHVPGHTVAAHEEGREAGAVIHAGFAELQRQLEKQKAAVRHERLVRRSRLAPVWLAMCVWLPPAPLRAADEPALSAQAQEAARLLQSDDAYQREVGFLRLEALREPASVPVIQRYLDDRDPDIRAYSVRALGAVQGPTAIPALLEIARDREPRVRRAALLALEPLEPADPAILPAFLRALRDRKPDVRMTAVDIVSRINEAQAREAILTRFRRERNPDVRRVLTLAMRRIGA